MKRWGPRSQRLISSYIQGWFADQLGTDKYPFWEDLDNGFYAMYSSRSSPRKAVIIGHPLWISNPDLMNDKQAELFEIPLSEGVPENMITFSSAYELQNNPIRLLQKV